MLPDVAYRRRTQALVGKEPPALCQKVLGFLTRSQRSLEPIGALADATPCVTLVVFELHHLRGCLRNGALASPPRRVAANRCGGLANLAGGFSETQISYRQTVVGDSVLHLRDDLRHLLLAQDLGLRLERGNLRIQCREGGPTFSCCHVSVLGVRRRRHRIGQLRAAACVQLKALGGCHDLIAACFTKLGRLHLKGCLVLGAEVRAGFHRRVDLVKRRVHDRQEMQP